MTTKADLYRLIDELPEPALPIAERLLSSLEAQEAALPPILRNAPLDDEPETEEERVAVAEAFEALKHGKVLTDEELASELGL